MESNAKHVQCPWVPLRSYGIRLQNASDSMESNTKARHREQNHRPVPKDSIMFVKKSAPKRF